MEIKLTAEEGVVLLEAAAEKVAAFQVAFIRFLGDNEEDDAELAGSGTLVVVSEGRHGILTADHVIKNLPRKGNIGFLLEMSQNPIVARFVVDAENLELVTVGAASYTAAGPDLGLVLLPESTVGRIGAFNKVFYNLSKRQKMMLESPPAINRGFWALSGVIHQWTTDLVPERRFTRVKGFRGFCGAGVITPPVTRGDFDYLTFETRFGESYGGPQNYEGVSGGGIWHVMINVRDDKADVADCLLAGVVFYQESVTGGIDLSCHGPRSVYEHAMVPLKGSGGV